MKVIAPRVVTDSILSATNLVETDNVPYAPTSTYAKGARVRRASVFDFTSGALPVGATLARASSGTYTNAAGLLATAAANVARFEYLNGVCQGLLAEPQRTNIVISSSDLSGAPWYLEGGTTRTTGAVDPAGGSLASTVGHTSSAIQQLAQALTGLTANAIYGFSIYARSGTATVHHGRTDNRQGPGVGLYGSLALATAYSRLTVAGIASNNGNGTFVASTNTSDVGGSYTAIPGTYGTRALYGAQLELIGAGEAPRVTSYIPTTTAAATRAADVLTLNWATRGATDGSYIARYTFSDGTTQDIATTVSSGVSTVSATLLNRFIITRVQLVGLPDGVRVYESLQAANTGHALTDPAWWLDVGPTNRWAMFDGAVGSVSRGTGSITVTLAPGAAIDSLAVLELDAASVRVQIAATGYDQTKLTNGVASAALTFFELPNVANATVVVTIAGATGGAAVTAGALLIGNIADLGITEAGPSIGINDFSKRQTDDFGVTSIVDRGWAKRMTIRSQIATASVDTVQRKLASLRALPSLWIGEDDYDSLVIYGFFKDFSIDLPLATVSYCTLTIEGMTTAIDLDQDTSGEIDALTGQVDAALAAVAVIQSDGFLSAGEKPDIIRRANDASGEAPDIIARAAAIGVASAAYEAAYAALSAYLNALVPAYTNTTTDTPIVPATFNAKFSDYYYARMALLNAISAKAATMANWNGIPSGSGKPADNADVTATSQVVVGEVPEIVLPASAAGVIADGALPVAILAQVTIGGVDVRAAAFTTYALTNVSGSLSGSSGNLAVNTTTDKGRITLSVVGGSGSGDLVVTVNGVAQYPAKKVVVTVKRAPVVGTGGTGGGGGGGGSGSTTAGDVSGRSVLSTTLAQAAIFTGLVVPSGKTLSASLSAEYNVSGTTSGSANMVAKFQYAPTGTTTWTDFGAAVTGNIATRLSNGDTEPGNISVAQAVTPAAATYDVRVVWALSLGARTLITTSGPVSVSISA